MEDSVKEQQPSVVNSGKSKLRYPLRSATKAKEEKAAAELPNSSASRRGRPVSTVSKSVGVLDLSGKEKSAAKPPRRLSIPTKSVVSPPSRLAGTAGTITPISETRIKRSTNTGHGKSDTPLSNVSKSTTTRKKFNVLFSTSHWLKQIEYSESAAKHSISLGLFKLALEAGCEPLQQLRNELKSYVRRHQLGEQLGESVKELFDSYNIPDNQDQVQVSETCSQVPEEGTRSSDDEVHSSSSTAETRKLRPRSLNTGADKVSSATKESAQKNSTATRVRGSSNKSAANSRSASDGGSRKLQKKPQKPSKLGANKEKIRQQGKKSSTEEGSVSPSAAAVTPEENKENMDARLMEEVSPTEVM